MISESMSNPSNATSPLSRRALLGYGVAAIPAQFMYVLILIMYMKYAVDKWLELDRVQQAQSQKIREMQERELEEVRRAAREAVEKVSSTSETMRTAESNAENEEDDGSVDKNLPPSQQNHHHPQASGMCTDRVSRRAVPLAECAGGARD